MIDLEKNVIVFKEQTNAIRRWDVWFQTPFGLAQSVVEANEICKNKELEPSFSIKPVCVAITDCGHEVWMQ